MNGLDPTGAFTLKTVMITGAIVTLLGATLGVRAGGVVGGLKGIAAGIAFTTAFVIGRLNPGSLKRALIAGTLGALTALAIDLTWQRYDPNLMEPEITFDVFQTFAWSFADASITGLWSGGDSAAEAGLSALFQGGKVALDYLLLLMSGASLDEIEIARREAFNSLAFIIAGMGVSWALGGALGGVGRLMRGWPSYLARKMSERTARLIQTGVWVGLNTIGDRAAAYLLGSAAQFFFCKFVECQTEGWDWHCMLR